MQFNFNFEAFEKSGKEKNEAINYLKSLNSSIDFDKLEQENKGDENAIYEALKGGNFSFSKPSIEQTRQKLLKNKENEALKAEFNAGLSWLGEDKRQNFNFYDFKKAKEKANSKQGLIQADLKAQEKELKRKEALFETRLKERGIIAKSFDDMLDQSGAYLGADLLEKGLNKLGFKDENYIFESEKEDIKSRALKSVREKLEKGDLEFNEREKHALRSKYDELDYKKALEKEKERLRLSQKSGNFNEAEREFIENDLGFFNTLFNDDKENVKEFKEKVKSEGVISSEIIKAANTLKAFDEGNLFKNMLFADEKEKKEFQQNFLNDAYKIAELSGFDDVGLDKKGELYFIKDEQKYLVNTGFFDNFAQLLNDTKFEFAGGVLGGLKGFNSGKSAKGKVAKSILGAAAGSFGGAFLDAKIADMYLNRESDFKKNLDFAIQAGLLSMAGDGVILSVKPLAKGLYKGVKKGGEILGEYSILGTLKTLPEQNIQAAEKIIDEVFSPKMKEELKAAQEEFGGSVRGEDLKNAFFANLQKKFTQKYGENDSKTKSVAKIAEIFNTNSLKTRQQAMLDLVRSDKDGSTLAYLLEIAKDDVKIQSNLKNMLNLASSNVEKNLKNLNINPREIKHILDEFEAGNKAAFKEVESQISKLYDENYRVVLSKGEYENIKEEFRQNGVNLEEMTPFLRDLEANVFNENGVTFTQLNNFRKNLNFYIFNRDKTPNFINTLKKIGENILKNEIDKGIDNIFSQNKAAYESIKELYSTSLKDYATLKSLNESIKNLKLQDSAKSADEVLNSLIKYAKGQGEKGVNNLQKIKDYLGEENNAFLEMQILNKLFKESVVENDRASLRVFDSESFLGRVRELVGENELYERKIGKEFLEELSPSAMPKQISIDEFLNTLENFKNKENFLKHIEKDPKRKDYLNLIEPTLKEPDIAFKKLENGVEKEKFIKKFSDGKDFFYLLATKDNKETILTAFKTDKINTILKEFNADIIPTFIRQGSKGKAAGTTNEGIITQPLFKSKEAREFLELVEGFHKLYKNDASIAKNLVQGTSEKLSTSIATSAEGAIKQKVVKGAFDPIFRLLPDKILFGLFSKQIQGGALRYHLKKALSRSLNYDDFKIKLEKELKRTNFNSNTSRLIDEFMQNLEDFNREKEQFLEAKRIEQARIKEEEQARINTIKTAQENAYNAQEANLGKDILEPSSLKEDFGENFAGYKGKEAIEKLLEEQRGQVKGAFYKEGLGEIDLVWGEITDLEKHKGYGLAHILDKRKSEFVEQGASQSEAAQKAAEFAKNEISNIMQNGKIINKANEATRIETQDYRLILKQNWKGEPTKNKWLVTAYMKKEKGESISSTPFTKEDNLSLNSKESIAQKALNLHEKLYLKDNDTPLNVEYKIVNKDDIKPSFTLSKTQFRSQKQEDLIKKIKENFNPDLLVNIRGDLKKGNPIITKEGEVISGNHRAAALKELEGENLAKYQNAVKEAFGVELKENEMLVRVADTSEAEIRRFSAASNEGLENNLGEQGVSLFAKYQDKIKALKEAKKPFVADDVYNLKYLVNKALGESSITKENDTSKALFASLARGRNNTILKALNELEKENLEQVSKVANMFFDNAGAFYKEGLGEIDLVWGDKNYGLEHILNKHGGEFKNLARELSEAVENGKIVKDDKGRLRLEYENKIVGIKDNWKGEKTAHWVVTAYVKKEKEASLYTSASFTKGEALPLNSNESIAQKAKNDEVLEAEVIEEVGLNEPMKFLEFQQRKLLSYIKENTPLKLLEHKKELKTRDILNFLEQSALNGKQKVFLMRNLERDLGKIELKIKENESVKAKIKNTYEISQSEAKELEEHFNFKGKKPLLRELRENEIKHALKSHGNKESEEARGNIAITLQDIEANYPKITQEYDEKFFTQKGVIYVKQVNGHHIVIEEALSGQDKLIFKTMWKTKGNYNKEVLLKNAKTSPYPQNADEAVRLETISKQELEQSNPQQSHLSTDESITQNSQEAKIKEAVKNHNAIYKEILDNDYIFTDERSKMFRKRERELIENLAKDEKVQAFTSQWGYPFKKDGELHGVGLDYKAKVYGKGKHKMMRVSGGGFGSKAFQKKKERLLELEKERLQEAFKADFGIDGFISKYVENGFFETLWRETSAYKGTDYGWGVDPREYYPYYENRIMPSDTITQAKEKLQKEKSNWSVKRQEAKGSEDIIFTDKKGKEHTLTKETQKAWLEAFGLKSLEEAYIPNFKAEVKEAINRVLGGEEIKLTKGSFEKLLKRDREEFLPYIKDTLEKADLIIKDKENALIFVKDIGKKSYFTSVAKNANNEWVISTNSLKTLNTLKNRVDDNGEVLYLSKEAPNILAEAFTKRAFSNELAKDIIPQKPQQKALNLQEIEQSLKARKSQINDEISANDKAFKENLKEVSKVKPILEALKKEWEALEPTIVTWTHTDYSKAKPKKYYKRKPNLSNLWHIEETLDVYKGYARESDRHANQVAREIALLEKYVKLLKDKEAEVKAFKAKAEADENALILESRIIPIYNQLREAFKKGHHTTKQILEANNIKQDSVQAKEVIDSIAQTRQYLEDTFNIKPLEEFGTNYAEFYRDGKGAVEKLLKEAEDFKQRGEKGEFKGQVAGAFYKEGLGEIDLVWGDSKKGLSHILERRKEDFIKQGLDENEALERALEFVKKIPQIIEQGEVKVGVNRAFVDTKDDRALIALDYKGKDKKWVITAYKMDDPSQADTHLTRLNTSTSSVSRASVVNESIAQNEHNAVAWDEFEAFKDKDDILKANLKGEQNSAKENEAKRQADEYESLNAIQQERGGGLFTNEELNRGQSRHARGNERDGVGVSKVDGSKSQTLFSEGDFENSRTRSGGNGGRGYTAGEENALSIRGNNSSSGEVLNADENYIRENNPRYNDTKRPREDNSVQSKRSLHMGANKTNGGANDRSILLKPQWSEALEKQGLFTSFAKAQKRSEKFTFTDTSDANKILEDNFQALEGLKYVIKSGFDNNVRSQNLQSLQNFRGFGKGTNALLKLRGEEKEKWAKLLKELTDLTGEKITITDLVKRSADAYYTPDVIIGKMANLTEFFAKEAGEDLAKLIKLEPSAGIGRFLNAFELSNFYAVEKDALSANIAKALYEKGGAIINNGAYEKSPLKINNTFDLVIGNPPYANFKIGDDEFRENIHNYFMKKNIDVLKPNGLSLQIITHNFLDAQSDYTRKVMAKDAVFLGAVRLANNVFKDASVTTDIIAFRKKAPDEMDKEFNTSWVESVEYEGAYLNKYFLENPQNVIGKMEVVKNQFGGKTIAVKPNGFDIENLNLSNYIKNDKLFKRVEGYIDNKLLSKAVQRIEEKEKGVSFFGSARSGELRFDKESDKFLVLDDQQNTHDFNIYERISEAKPNWQESSINNRVEALKEMMPQIEKLKKALFDLKEAELNPNSSDEKIEILRRILNKAYDELHGKNGSFRNARGKISQKWELYDILDDTSFELFALEKKAIVEERGDKKIVIGSEKSEIFHKRLVKPYEAPTSANNINEALQISKAEYGKIDLVRMSELLSKDMSEVENELLEQKRIYKDHLGGNVEKDEFLSGNVREKIARFYDENGSLNLSSDEKIRAFQMQSLEDLKAIVPDDIELPFINIPLGATWLNKEILREFFAKELEIGEVNFKRAGNRWYLLGKFNGSLEITTSEDYLRDTGIKAINAVDYILKMMNNESLEVKTSKTKADGSIKHYKDPIATQKLQDLKIKLEKQLKNFIMDNEEYAEQTKRVYNDVFNSEVIRKYDGSHIRLMETNEDISLRSHQNNAVYRFLQKSNTLLAHDVGTGKTYTMIASAMLSKQLGLAKKSLIVTPNNVSPQMAREARELFPNARIKLIQGVSTKEKNRLMADVKNNEYDLIIVSYDTFKVMNANPKLYADYLNEELIQLRCAIEALENSDEGDERIMKQLAKRLESEEAKLEHYLEQVANGSQNVFFEDLGIDNLIFDEAHYLKKLPIFTKQGNVRGIQRGKSQRALDAYIKIKHHQSLNKKVMFATGTPITNFVSDIYVMQKFLGRKALEDSNISEFDDWSAMFAGSQTQFELKASGNYEATTRLRNFANLPELKKMYYEFTDVVTKDDVKKQIMESTGEQIEPTPVYEEVIIKQSEAQKAFYEEIKERAVNLKGKKIEKGGDNHLKILSDANKASLDMRLIYPHLERDANGKVMQAAEKIVENYHLWDADKGTQLVFLDKSTPKKSITSAKRAKLENKLSAIKEKLEKYENDDINLSEEALEKLEKEKVEIEEILEMAGEGFSVYEDLRKLLIEKGIKPEEIAFVQDYDKAGTGALSQAELSEKINNGKIRVLIGSTAKMGAGANYQRKLSALHHLDLDWTPANMEQREGRIIRQGNELFKKYGDEFKAKIYYYVTEQTSDTVMLQTLNQKRKIIKQITDINEKARFLEDSSEDDFMARLQAATSPYAEEELRFLGIDKEISLLNSELENSAYVIKSAEREILKQNEAVEGFEAIKSLLPSILKKAENNISFKTKEGKIIDFNAKPKKDEASPHEKLNMSVKKSIESLFNSSEKLMQIGEYRGSKLFALKAGNAKCVIKMGENLQNSLYFTELDYMDIKGAFSANLRFKNAFEKISKNSYFTDLEQKIKDAKEAQKRALKKLENEKARDLSEINKTLNDALVEKAELAIFLGRAEQEHKSLVSAVHNVPDIKENEEDKFTKLEEFIMAKYNKN
ncbi:DEAD/DEAH box helicase family protein [Campylobacter upsaliensis]|nr:DEAD/DEAH box helicase family protein [Campylobacter upsaliensis]